MIKEDLLALSALTKRSVKIFLKDKLAVFFSLFAPMIVLVLYILFLGTVQYDSIVDSLPEGMEYSKKAISSLLDSWMIAGVLTVACITVSLNANMIMVKDRSKGCLSDFLSSPVRGRIITLSYFTFNYIVTAVICTIVYAVGLGYLMLSGHMCMSAADIVATEGIILLASALSNVMFVLIAGFFKSEAALSGLCGVASAAVGFLTGAYMPIDLFPKPVKYIIGFLPNSYTGALFRNILMRGALSNLSSEMSSTFAEELSKVYSMNMELFGCSISLLASIVIVVGSIIVFSILNVLFSNKKASKS